MTWPKSAAFISVVRLRLVNEELMNGILEEASFSEADREGLQHPACEIAPGRLRSRTRRLPLVLDAAHRLPPVLIRDPDQRRQPDDYDQAKTVMPIYQRTARPWRRFTVRRYSTFARVLISGVLSSCDSSEPRERQERARRSRWRGEARQISEEITEVRISAFLIGI